MLGSMYSAVSGLAAHQTKMNVIGNNIANVNTYGFKASRATFSDVFYQTINGASEPVGGSAKSGIGGTNPVQLGYGAKINSIDVINTRAGSATTDRALDVYINGEGYLAVQDGDQINKYTRVGILNFDKSGNLVDANGNRVLGFELDPTTKNAQLDANGTRPVNNLKPINVANLDKYSGISIGQNGEVVGIKEGEPVMVPNAEWLSGTQTVSASSNLKSSLVMTATRKMSAGPVQVSSNATMGAGEMKISLSGSTYTLTYPNPSGVGTTTATAALSSVDTSTTPKTITFQVPGLNSTTATVKVPLTATTGATGFAVPADGSDVVLGDVQATTAGYNLNVTAYNKAGAKVPLTASWTSGTQISLGDITLNIDATKFQSALDAGISDIGIGTVGPGAGISEKIAHIAVVNFTNSNGLSQEGEGYYMGTTNSGSAVATIPGSGGTGTFRAGALEMSNVDLSREFTEMIITQRGFQANTRMITVSDEMLSELVSMKR